jgi:hypothetical protein
VAVALAWRNAPIRGFAATLGDLFAQCANVRHAAIIYSDERLPKDAMQHQSTTVIYGTQMLAAAGFVPCGLIYRGEGPGGRFSTRAVYPLRSTPLRS